MKYIIFEKTPKGDLTTKLIMPIMFPDHVTHSQVKIDGCVAVSAGFYRLTVLYDVAVYGHSESLNLITRNIDAEYLKRAILDGGTGSFLE